jgi:hypothetical protein
MSTEPKGIYVGAPEPRPRPPRGRGPDFSSVNPYLASLMSRWNEVMDIQTKRLEGQAGRDETAFQEWRQGKDIAQREAELGTDIAYNQERDREEALLRAREQEAEDELAARERERSRVLASVDRARTMQTTYGGPTGFTPAGTLGDYYEYGAGNPAGRGGGGSVGGGHVSDTRGGIGSPEWAAMDLRNCMNNPSGPGCPEMLTQAMMQGGF